MARKAIRMKPLHLFVLCVVMSYAAWSTQKPVVPILSINQLLTFVNDKFVDLSGKFVPWVQSFSKTATLQALDPVYTAVDSLIAEGTNNLAIIQSAVETNEIDRIYISFSVPRSTPDNPDTDLAIKILRTAETTENGITYIDSWTWFSFPPETNITVHCEYSITHEQWHPMELITNTWPAVEYVGETATYRYRYIKPATTGILIVEPEVSFGSKSGHYLDTSGFIVRQDGIYRIGHTGWDDYSEGNEILRARNSGGIAVEIYHNGVTIRSTQPRAMAAETITPDTQIIPQ